MSYSETIPVQIMGKEFECYVEFEFTKGEPAITHLSPEFCYEGSPDEYSIISFAVIEAKDDRELLHPLDFLIPELKDFIINELELIRNDQ